MRATSIWPSVVKKKISYRPSKDKYYPNSLTGNPFVSTFVFNRECQRMMRLHQTSIEAQPSLSGHHSGKASRCDEIRKSSAPPSIHSIPSILYFFVDFYSG